MLLLAIVLTVVAATLFAAGIILAGYAVASKVRQLRHESGSDTKVADNPSVP